MVEYIKKEDVLKEVVRFSTEEGSNTVCSKLYCDMGLMPTIDIVHCKDCKHSNVDKMGWYCNKHYHRYADENAHFCSDGEREREAI